ncbi:hypothetical protein IV37_GL000169 [Fructilactobacillus fructivorans]|nr:hypothetical protein IV37_GL000169 [Fructilactobacillus fructivorans]
MGKIEPIKKVVQDMNDEAQKFYGNIDKESLKVVGHIEVELIDGQFMATNHQIISKFKNKECW